MKNAKMRTINTKVFVVFLVSLGMASCTNNQAKLQENQAKLQEEYQKSISDAMYSIQGKYDFLKKMYDGKESNTKCVDYENVDKLSSKEIRMISQSLPDKEVPQNDKSGCLVQYIPSKNGLNVNMEWWDRVFGSGIYSYANKKVLDESTKEKCFSEFNSDVVRPLQSAKFFIKVTDVIFVKPKINLYDYESGYVLSHVDVYDINTKEIVDSFEVAASNSDKLRFYMEDNNFFIDKDKAAPKLKTDLYHRLRDNVYDKTLERQNK